MLRGPQRAPPSAIPECARPSAVHQCFDFAEEGAVLAQGEPLVEQAFDNGKTIPLEPGGVVLNELLVRNHS